MDPLDAAKPAHRCLEGALQNPTKVCEVLALSMYNAEKPPFSEEPLRVHQIEREL